jgi:hypothetical protein
MKKNSIPFFVVLIIAVSFSNCDDFLSPSPDGMYTESNYFKSEQDAVNAVSAIYASMLSDLFTGHDDCTYDACSDDVYNYGDHTEEDLVVNLFTVTPFNARLANNQWQPKYEMISRANLIIINVPKMTRDQISEAIQNRCTGEAYFLRAFAHWWLYLVHGEIPVITDEDVLNNNYNKPKSSIDEVLAQIEHDLLKAAELLPPTIPASESGRVHQGSAWGYLTQLYMHWSCFPNKDDMLDKAIEAGNHIIGKPEYKMADNFEDCFNLKRGATNTEMLFQMNGDNGVGLSQDLENIYFWILGNWGGESWLFWVPTKSLANAFGTDPRKAKTILSDGDQLTVGDVTHTFYSNVDPKTAAGYAFRKNAQYMLVEPDKFERDLSAVFPLMRSADVYLLVAEAKIRKGSSGDAEINAVRNRVGLPPISGATYNDLIRERRLELAGENRRFFDLRRWDRIGWVDISSILADPDAYNGTSRTFVSPKHYFFPIPYDQIIKTNGVLEQNPEYL